MPLPQLSKIKNLTLALLLAATTYDCGDDKTPRTHSNPSKRRTNYAKLSPPNLPVKECESPSLRGVRLHDPFSDRGRMERSLRWEDITDAVEHRYGIPEGYLLGMVAQESMGDPTMPNKIGDAGLGLIHMQPLLTNQYGLKMITNSRKLRDFNQGKRINSMLRATNYDLVDLTAYDDRWHPVKNVDAAARMLADHYQRSGSWKAALHRYAGRSSYPSKVIRFAKLSSDDDYLAKLAAEFNTRNRSLIVDGKPLTYARYLDIAHKQNACQFGISTYRTLPRRVP